MSRRELLISMLQALFLALFPWLRTEHGVERLHEVLDRTLPDTAKAIFKGGTWQISFGIKGYELSPEMAERLVDMEQLVTIGVEDAVD